MKYLNISEFFNKLYSAVFALLLVSMLVFIVLYTLLLSGDPVMPSSPMLTTIVLVFVTVDWITVLFVTSNKMKSVRKEQGLGLKLEKYFTLTIVRYSAVAFANLALGVAFYLTHDNIFSIVFGVNLLASMIFWPAPHRVARELRLRGDEYEMVYYKKDRF